MKLVQKQNLDYLHIKSHFSIPYYQFMKQLLIVNYNFAKTQIDANNPNEPMVRHNVTTQSILVSENVIKIFGDFGAIFWKKPWAIALGIFQILGVFLKWP